MSTALHKSMVSFTYANDEIKELMLKVWENTPWMIDVLTNNRDLDIRMRNWCHKEFGPEAWPIHDRPGTWQRGSATINGSTWWGFSTRAQLLKFCTQWNIKMVE